MNSGKKTIRRIREVADISEQCNGEEECEQPLLVLVKEEHSDYEEEGEEFGEEYIQKSQEDFLGEPKEVRCEEDEQQQIQQQLQQQQMQQQQQQYEQRDEVQLASTVPGDEVNDFMKRVTMPGTKIILFVKRLEGTVVGNTIKKTMVTEAPSGVKAKLPLKKAADKPCVPPRRAAKDVDYSLVPPPPKPGPAPIHLPDGRIGCACGKMFARIAWYERHGPTCALQRTFKCNVCNKAFRYNCYLRRHMESHAEGRPYLCDLCGLVFKEDVHLYEHRRRHSGRQPHVCGLCGDTFTLSSSLEAHLRQHKLEHPFQCETCGMCFKQKGHLNMHQRTHRQAASENKQPTPNAHVHLHQHKLEHPFQCETCGMRFKQKGHLNMHQRTHRQATDINKIPTPNAHVCSRCGTSFMYASRLRRHSCKLRMKRQWHPHNKLHAQESCGTWKGCQKESTKEDKGDLEVKEDGTDVAVDRYEEDQEEDVYLQDMEEVEYPQDMEGEQGSLNSNEDVLQDMMVEFLHDEENKVVKVENNTRDIEVDEEYLQDIEEVYEEQEEGEGMRKDPIEGAETAEEWTRSTRQGMDDEVQEEEELEMEEEWIDERFELEEEEEVVDVT